MSFRDKLKKYDKAVIGVTVGLVFTILGYFLSYPILTRTYADYTLERYFYYTVNGPDRQQILIFSLLPNMFLFYFVNFRWNLGEFTKGLVAITLLLGLLLVILSF